MTVDFLVNHDLLGEVFLKLTKFSCFCSCIDSARLFEQYRKTIQSLDVLINSIKGLYG